MSKIAAKYAFFCDFSAPMGNISGTRDFPHQGGSQRASKDHIDQKQS